MVGLLFWLVANLLLGWIWQRSYSRTDVLVFFGHSGSVHGIMSHRGGLMVASSTLVLAPDRSLRLQRTELPLVDGDWLYQQAYQRAPVSKRWLDFGRSEVVAGQIPSSPQDLWWTIVFPHWLPSGICWLMTIRHFMRFTFRTRERRRRKLGQCVNCGYDLRGIASDRCPECGDPVNVDSEGAADGAQDVQAAAADFPAAPIAGTEMPRSSSPM